MNWLHSYMACTAHTIAPHEFRYWAAISCIAAALGRKVSVRVTPKHNQNAWPTPPNLYILIVGSPDGGKTNAVKQCKRMLMELGLPLAADTTTRAKMFDSMAAAGGSMALVNGEFGVFMRGSGSGKEVADPELTMLLTKLYDLDPVFKHETITSTNAKLEDGFLTVLAATTPNDLHKLFPISRGIGFLSRMLVIFREGRVFKDPDAYIDEDGWAQCVEQLGRIREMEGSFAFDDNASAAYRIWNLGIFKKYEHVTTEEGTRLQDMAARIAMCHAAAEYSYVVTLDHFRVALERLDEAVEGRGKVVRLATGNPMRPVMDGVLEFVRNGGIKRALYFDHYRDYGTEKQLQAVLSHLATAQRITYVGDEPHRKIVAWDSQ